MTNKDKESKTKSVEEKLETRVVDCLPILFPIASLSPYSVAKIQFEDKKSESRAFALFIENDYPVTRSGKVYSISSSKQLELLDENKISYKLVD